MAEIKIIIARYRNSIEQFKDGKKNYIFKKKNKVFFK